jgi:hypothetical protein
MINLMWKEEHKRTNLAYMKHVSNIFRCYVDVMIVKNVIEFIFSLLFLLIFASVSCHGSTFFSSTCTDIKCNCAVYMHFEFKKSANYFIWPIEDSLDCL